MIHRQLLEAGVEGEVLRDDQWERLREFVPGGRKGKRVRIVTAAVFWMRCMAGAFRGALACSAGEVRPLSDGQAALLPLGRTRGGRPDLRGGVG